MYSDDNRTRWLDDKTFCNGFIQGAIVPSLRFRPSKFPAPFCQSFFESMVPLLVVRDFIISVREEAADVLGCQNDGGGFAKIRAKRNKNCFCIFTYFPMDHDYFLMLFSPKTKTNKDDSK